MKINLENPDKPKVLTFQWRTLRAKVIYRKNKPTIYTLDSGAWRYVSRHVGGRFVRAIEALARGPIFFAENMGASAEDIQMADKLWKEYKNSDIAIMDHL